MNKTSCYVYCYLNTLKPGNYNYNTIIGDISFNYEPFYIGKGSNKRYLDHIKFPNTDKNKLKQNIINKIINRTNNYPLITFIKKELSHKEALLLEMNLISVIGRRDLNLGPLCNLTDGGDGCIGFIFTEDLKIKWSELAKKRAKFGKDNHSSKKVYQYDLNGNFIKEWFCKEDIKRDLGFNPTGINACCKGRAKTAFSFRWYESYLGDKINPITKGKTKKDGYLQFKDTRYKKKLHEI